MPESNTSASSSDTSSGLPSPPSSHSQRGCWVAHVAGLAAIGVVGWPIGQVLPELLRHMKATGDWKPFALAMVPLSMLLAPVDFWGLVRGVAAARLPGKTEK